MFQGAAAGDSRPASLSPPHTSELCSLPGNAYLKLEQALLDRESNSKLGTQLDLDLDSFIKNSVLNVEGNTTTVAPH